MEYFTNNVIHIFASTSVEIQFILLFLFSYSEGLPVIGSILPGGTIAIFAGSLSATGIFSPITAAIILSVGSFAGDMTGFLLGKKYKHTRFIQKIVYQEKHQKVWDLFDRHITIISIFGKIIPVIRSTPSIFAGARGQKTRKYILYSFIGSFIWGVTGIYAGNVLASFFGKNVLLILIWIILLTFTIFIVKFLFNFIKNRF